MPRTELQYEEIRHAKKEIILSAALKLFAINGYHSTTISSIAREAGISKGLIYNYFESKEQLLAELISTYFDLLDRILCPANANEMNGKDMSAFLDNLRKSLKEESKYWRLFAQLSLQTDVLAFLMEKYAAGAGAGKHQQLIMGYFAKYFDDYVTEAFLFSSIIKGFSIQYAFSPELFDEELIEHFFNKLKSLYVKENINEPNI